MDVHADQQEGLGMDPLKFLHVRYHYSGEFLTGDKSLTYVGGTVASSFIERDKLSYLELIDHLKTHLPTYNEGQYLYWLYPGRQLFEGLKTIIDDEGCQGISNIITDGGVAEIFVEPMMSVTEDTDGSNYEDEMTMCVQAGHSKEIHDDEGVVVSGQKMAISLCSPSRTKDVMVSQRPKKKGKEIVGSYSSAGAPSCKKNQLDIDLARQKGVVADGDGSSSDSEYMPGDSEASDEDDEAIAIKKKFKEFKKLLKSGKTVNLDDLIFEGHSVLPPSKSDDEALSDKSNDTPYYDSSDDEASYDEQSDGELVRNNEDLPRYNSKSDVPFFALGMRFRGRKQFRKAIIKHGLADKTTCEKKVAATTSTMTEPSAHAAPLSQPVRGKVMASNRTLSTTSETSGASKATTAADGLSLSDMTKKISGNHLDPHQKRKRALPSANMPVQVAPASISLNAHDKSSQASSSITNINSGSVSARACVLQPTKKIKKKSLPLMLQED